jgi:hypothetical protein
VKTWKQTSTGLGDLGIGLTLMKRREQELFHSVDWLSMEAESERAKPKVVAAVVYILFVFSCIELLMVVGSSFLKQIICYTAFPYSYLFPMAAPRCLHKRPVPFAAPHT